MDVSETNIVGSENCLYLNIHTTAFMPPPSPFVLFKDPQSTADYDDDDDGLKLQTPIRKNRPLLYSGVQASSQMPVLVWLHGGSYNFGSATSDTNGTDYFVGKV